MKKNTKEKLNKIKNSAKANIKQESKKISKTYFLFLLGTLAFVFLLTFILFGKLISVATTFMLLLLVVCTQVLDNNVKDSNKRKIVKSLFVTILIVGIIGIACFIAFFTYIILKSPEFDVEKLERGETTLIYDNKNKLVATLGNEKREKITYNEMPEVLVNAIVATEDSRYFQHNGFDAPRFAKAMLGQVLGSSGAGGASTITMQVAKNNFTSTEAGGIEGIIRKFTDIYLSIFKIERAFTKQEILEFYVNAPYLGGSAYGVEQACQTYFGKSTSEINLAEASIIAGLFQAPASYDPLVYPENTKERQETVLSLMVKHGYITEDEKEKALAIPIEQLLGNSSSKVSSEYQDYIDTVAEEILKNTGLDPYVTPMIVYTNMDSEKQLALRKIFDGETYKWPNKTIQAGVMAIESATGKILAIGAGRNRVGERTFNYATDIKRQIGSTAKPLFDYGPGMEYLNWSTGKIFNDKVHYYTGNTSAIVNYDFKYLGKITLRYSLSDSRNVPAVIAFQSIENSKIKEFVTSLGIEPEYDDSGYIHEAHSLGAFNGASPLRMAAAYSAFSNGGYYTEPYTVKKVILRESNEELEFESDTNKVMSASTAYMITDILKTVAVSTGVNSQVKDTVALKTGSTNYDKETQKLYGYPSTATPDAWIVGYTPNISMAMWTGYTTNEVGVYMTNSKIIAHRNALYRALAKAVFDNKTNTFTKPSSVVSVKLEKGTELLPSEQTPSNQIVTELFKRGTEPTEQSSKYKTLDNVTGLIVEYEDGTSKIKWNSINPPSDLTDDDSYGAFGYYVYLNGTELGFTSNNYYNYSTSNPYGTYTIKTAFKKLSTNRSSGATYTIDSNINFTFNEQSSISLNIGDSYAENNPSIIVKENGIDVTNSATINKTISDLINNKIVTQIDTTKTGKYQVTYTASYGGQTQSFTKKVIIN